MTSTTTSGLIAGLGLGFAGAFGGFDAFVIVLLFGAIGLAVGLLVDRVSSGQLDLSSLGGRSR